MGQGQSPGGGPGSKPPEAPEFYRFCRVKMFSDLDFLNIEHRLLNIFLFVIIQKIHKIIYNILRFVDLRSAVIPSNPSAL